MYPAALSTNQLAAVSYDDEHCVIELEPIERTVWVTDEDQLAEFGAGEYPSPVPRGGLSCGKQNPDPVPSSRYAMTRSRASVPPGLLR